MWEETLKRWIDLVFWWLPKHEEPGPGATDQPGPAAAQASAECSVPEKAVPEKAVPEHAASEPVADDLTVIKGIGPVVQNKLHALGIRTFVDLAAADPEALTEQLKGRQPISEALVRGWTEAADQRAGARH